MRNANIEFRIMDEGNRVHVRIVHLLLELKGNLHNGTADRY